MFKTQICNRLLQKYIHVFFSVPKLFNFVLMRMSNEIRIKKQNDGKRLYAKGRDVEFIAEMLEVSVKTINKWKKELDWSDARNTRQVSIDDISAEILQALYDIKEGNSLKINPDQLSKLVSAYKKINDMRSVLPYQIAAYDIATEHMLEYARGLSITKKKNYIKTVLQPVRNIFENIIENNYQKMLSEE